MTTSVKTPSTRPRSTDGLIAAGDLGYARASLCNAVHQYVLRRFMLEAKQSKVTRAEMARRLGKKPEQITRWLGAPGNWTRDTVCDMLLAMGLDPVDIVADDQSRLSQDNPLHCRTHELVAMREFSVAPAHFSNQSGTGQFGENPGMADLILASGSTTRRRMLEAAGVTFRVVPADVDEDAIRQSLVQHDHHGAPIRMAEVLARAKAEEVSRRHRQALVIGADQILSLGREVFTKPADLASARDALQRLSGHTHQLHSGVSLAIGGAEVWHHVETASLTMRALSAGFIDDYLARAGERVCASVGAYEIEGQGIQLFERIEGDYFTILGLPLLALLTELRRRGSVPA